MNVPISLKRRGVPALKGLRLFLVEDEALIAMLLETMLDDMGCVIVGHAGSVAQALDRVDEVAGRADAAILDVNLGGERSYPVADALAGRGVPFLFTTGYGSLPLDDRYPGRAVLAKPYVEATLARALLGLLPPRAAA